MLALAWRERVRLPFNRRQQSLALWGVWLLTMVVFFSIAGFFHKYYLSMLAPAICALTGIGIVTMWDDYRRGGWRRWLLPVALVGTATIQALVLAAYPDWSSKLTPAIVGICILAAVALVVGVARPRWPLDSRLLVAVAMLALLLAPAFWSGLSLAQGNGGTLPSAGPSPATSNSSFAGTFPDFPGGTRPEGFPGGTFPGGNKPGRFTRGGGLDSSTTDARMISYLEANQGQTKFLVAVDSSMTAAPIILATGKAVMALGGFSGSDPILTVQQLQHLIQNGTVRYFLLGGRGFGNFGGQNSDPTQWVSSNCTPVSTSLWSSSTGGQGFGQQLYDCVGKG
jgi:4-amino-4-deoxy-L-arabinose transferase-like glycosyltransferase